MTGREYDEKGEANKWDGKQMHENIIHAWYGVWSCHRHTQQQSNTRQETSGEEEEVEEVEQCLLVRTIRSYYYLIVDTRATRSAMVVS